jgi:hypothetical protein
MLSEESWQGNVNIVHLKYTETITLEELFQIFASRMGGKIRQIRYLQLDAGAVFDLLPVVLVSSLYNVMEDKTVRGYDVTMNTGGVVTFLEPSPDLFTTRPYPRYKHAEFIEKWLGFKNEQKREQEQTQENGEVK